MTHISNLELQRQRDLEARARMTELEREEAIRAGEIRLRLFNDERVRTKVRTGRAPSPIRHGTFNGYKQHDRRPADDPEATPCEACFEAARKHWRTSRQRQRKARQATRTQRPRS